MYSIGSVTGCESKEARKSWTTSRGTLIDWRPWHVLWLPVASQCQNNYRREFTVAKWLGTNHSLKHITKYMLIRDIHTRVNWVLYLFYFQFAREYDKNINFFFFTKINFSAFLLFIITFYCLYLSYIILNNIMIYLYTVLNFFNNTFIFFVIQYLQ